MDTTSDSNGAMSNGNDNGPSGRNNGLPDLINQKRSNGNLLIDFIFYYLKVILIIIMIFFKIRLIRPENI